MLKKFIWSIVLLCLFCPMIANAQEYKNNDAKIKFEIKDEIWNEESLSAERDYILKKWKNDDCGIL